MRIDNCITRRFLCSMAACLIAACPVLMAHDPHDPIDALAISPNYAQDHTVLAASDDFTLKQGVYAIFKTTDGGVTWSTITGLPNNTKAVSIVFSPAYATDQTFFAAGKGGLFGTTNQGATWTLLTNKELTSVGLSPNFATDNTLYVTSGKTLYRSKTRGETWKKLTAPAGLSGNLNLIAVSPNFASDNMLLLGSDKDGIFQSTNGGSSWAPVTSGLKSAVNGLAFSPAYGSDQTIYATTYGAGVQISTNRGSSWTRSNSGITDLDTTSVALSPTYTKDSTVWVSTAKAGVFQSANVGTSWTGPGLVARHLSPQNPQHYRQIVAASNGATNAMFMGMWEGLWTSSNGGSTWLYIDTLPTRLVRYINLSPNYANDQTVFGDTYGGGNLWSTNGGASWTFQNVGMHNSYTDSSTFSPNYVTDHTAFSGAELGLEKTTDAGASWQLLNGGLKQETYVRGLAVSPNYSKDGTLLIGTRNGPGSQGSHSCSASGAAPAAGHLPNGKYTGLFASTDGGVTWIKTSLTRLAKDGCWGVISAVFSPGYATDQTAFVASPDTGLYKSAGGVKNWNHLSLPDGQATVTISPNYTQDQTVFAAGILNSIAKSTDGGSTWIKLPGTSTLKAMDLQISPNYANDHSFLAATVQLGLVQFTNGGSSMTQISSFPDSFVSAVGYSPNFANDQTIFVASYHGVYKSTNAGATWVYTAEPSRVEEFRNVTSPGQQPPTITFQGSWSFVSPAALASTDAVEQTSTTGDTAVFNFVGTGVTWISTTGPSQGSAALQLDGNSQGSVPLNSPTVQYQQPVWQQQGLVCGLHTLTITGAQTVTVDAFDIRVDGCAFVQ